jgi:Predicted periplasmic or secreted lipoprotein
MNPSRFIATATFGCLLFAIPAAVAAPQDSAAKNNAEARAAQPDNTKKNKRDRNKNEATADQQKENTSDRELSAKIRRAIMDDKSLSTYAHNIKVIAQNGTVTLKGPVNTDEEKSAIQAKASEIAGAANVKSEISVKGSSREGTRSRSKSKKSS